MIMTDEVIVLILATDSVESTFSMHSILLLGGLRACLPGNLLYIKHLFINLILFCFQTKGSDMQVHKH